MLDASPSLDAGAGACSCLNLMCPALTPMGGLTLSEPGVDWWHVGGGAREGAERKETVVGKINEKIKIKSYVCCHQGLLNLTL